MEDSNDFQFFKVRAVTNKNYIIHFEHSGIELGGEVKNWLDEMIHHPYSICYMGMIFSYRTTPYIDIEFTDARDAMLFKLTWG